MKMKSERRFLNLFFDLLERENVDYFVIRNYETLPETVSGTDIDLIVSRKQYVVFREKLISKTRHVGYRKWKGYSKNYGLTQVSFVPELCDDPQDVVRIDFILENMNWLGFGLVDRRILWGNRIKENGIWVLGEPARTLLTLLNTFLYGGKLKERYLGEYRSLKGENRVFVKKCILDSFREYGNVVTQKLDHGSIEEINNLETTKIRFNFLKAKRFEPRSLLRGVAGWLRTGFSRAIDPPGLFVVLIGPDGCGKSTLSEMLGMKCKRMFPGISHFHLFPKPGIFSSLDKKSRARWEKQQLVNSEQELRRRRFSCVKSILRITYLLVRFWTGYLFWICPRIIRGHLVLGERWCFDLLFDPASKGIELPLWLRKLFFLLCPSPEKTIFLYGSADIIGKRKDDLTVEEIGRQIGEMENGLGGRKGVWLVDCTQETETTFGNVLKTLVSEDA